MAPIVPKQPPHELFDLCDKIMKNAQGIKQFTTQGGTPVHVMFYSGDNAPNILIELMRPNGVWDTFRLYKDDFRCEAIVLPSYASKDRVPQMQLTETPPYSQWMVQALNATYFKLIHSIRRTPYSDESVPFFTETEADAKFGALIRDVCLAADRAHLAVQKGPGIHEI